MLPSAHGLVYDVKKIWIGLACVFQKTRKLFGPVNSAFHNTFDKRFPKFVSNSRNSPLRKHLKRTSETVCQKYCETQYTRTQPDIFRECFFGNERLRLRESSGSRIELQIPRSCYWVAMGYPVLKWVWFFFFFYWVVMGYPVLKWGWFFFYWVACGNPVLKWASFFYWVAMGYPVLKWVWFFFFFFFPPVRNCNSCAILPV